METIMNCETPSSPTLSSDTEPDGMQFEYAIPDLHYKIALGTVDALIQRLGGLSAWESLDRNH
jgi:hypothetical protein